MPLMTYPVVEVMRISRVLLRLPQITTLHSLNDALGAINMHVTAAEEGPPATVEWAVRDGRSLYRFHDHMVRRLLSPLKSLKFITYDDHLVQRV